MKEIFNLLEKSRDIFKNNEANESGFCNFIKVMEECEDNINEADWLLREYISEANVMSNIAKNNILYESKDQLKICDMKIKTKELIDGKIRSASYASAKLFEVKKYLKISPFNLNSVMASLNASIKTIENMIKKEENKMKINFNVTQDELERFMDVYNVENYDRLQNGGCIISTSKFFLELIIFYNENKKK